MTTNEEEEENIPEHLMRIFTRELVELKTDKEVIGIGRIYPSNFPNQFWFQPLGTSKMQLFYGKLINDYASFEMWMN